MGISFHTGVHLDGYGQCSACPVLCDGTLYTCPRWGNLLCLGFERAVSSSGHRG
jgi:hypothetical protein